MKARKNRGQIKINPKVKKQLYSSKVAEKVKFEPLVKYGRAKSPIKAIRNKCLWCCGDSKFEVTHCPNTDCVLWEFRKGKNPFHTKELSEDQKSALCERLEKARSARVEKKSLLRKRGK